MLGCAGDVAYELVSRPSVKPGLKYLESVLGFPLSLGPGRPLQSWRYGSPGAPWNRPLQGCIFLVPRPGQAGRWAREITSTLEGREGQSPKNPCRGDPLNIIDLGRWTWHHFLLAGASAYLRMLACRDSFEATGILQPTTVFKIRPNSFLCAHSISWASPAWAKPSRSYVYAIVMSQPSEEVVRTGIKQPSDFDRSSFRELPVKCHAECDVQIIATACSRSPTGSREGGARRASQRTAHSFEPLPHNHPSDFQNICFA